LWGLSPTAGFESRRLPHRWPRTLLRPTPPSIDSLPQRCRRAVSTKTSVAPPSLESRILTASLSPPVSPAMHLNHCGSFISRSSRRRQRCSSSIAVGGGGGGKTSRDSMTSHTRHIRSFRRAPSQVQPPSVSAPDFPSLSVRRVGAIRTSSEVSESSKPRRRFRSSARAEASKNLCAAVVEPAALSLHARTQATDPPPEDPKRRSRVDVAVPETSVFRRADSRACCAPGLWAVSAISMHPRIPAESGLSISFPDVSMRFARRRRSSLPRRCTPDQPDQEMSRARPTAADLADFDLRNNINPPLLSVSFEHREPRKPKH